MKGYLVLILVLKLFPLCSQVRELDSITQLIGKATDKQEAAYQKATLSMKYLGIGQLREALDLFDEALSDAGKNATPRTLGALHHVRATVHYYNGSLDSAVFHYQLAVKNRLTAGDKVGALRSTGNIGNIYLTMGRTDLAQKYYEQALRMEEDLGVEEGTYTSMNNLASLYASLKLNAQAIKYYRKAASRAKKTGSAPELSTAYYGLAAIYKEELKYDSALYYIERSGELARHSAHLAGQAYALNSRAAIYMSMKRYQDALPLLRQGIALGETVGDKRLTAAAMGNLVACFVLLNQTDSAMKFMEPFITLNKQLNIKQMQPDLLKLSAEYYLARKEYEQAYSAMKLYAMVSDSIYRMQMLAKGAELQEKYESEKREKENQLLQSENERHRATSRLLVVILSLAITLLLVGYMAIRRIRKAKRIISDQKLLVEEKQKEILDSIQYARRIQYALLASEQLLKKYLPRHFVFFKPKAVVSGDFYWATNTEEGFTVVAGDCTGHGVPGAFLSLLNITKLGQIINELKISRPDQVLNKVREEIVRALNPEDSAEETKDGMDGVICNFRRDKTVMEYAAANNALYVVRNRQIIVCKPDKMPVGKSHAQHPFTYNEMLLQADDMVYMFTDGFADQFGGPLGKKFKYRQFEQLLVTVSGESMEKQKEQLEDAFESWRGSLEQVDDVCVLGIRV